MAEDADVASEITPEDFMADEQESPKAESSPAEEKNPEVVEKPKELEAEAAKPADKPKEPEAKETDTESEVEEKDKAEDTETDKPQKGADERKTQLNTEIRDLVAQRNALKREVAKANEVYQPATEQELVDEGLSATDAKVEALRQEIEVRDYNERVADAQLTIESEAQRVLNDFPNFNPNSDEFDKELADEAGELLQANLILDPNTGQVIGSNVSPYSIYKTLARASGISATKAQLKGQEATEKMLANADSGSSASPPKQKADPLKELWAEPL